MKPNFYALVVILPCIQTLLCWPVSSNREKIMLLDQKVTSLQHDYGMVVNHINLMITQYEEYHRDLTKRIDHLNTLYLYVLDEQKRGKRPRSSSLPNTSQQQHPQSSKSVRFTPTKF